MLIYIYLEAHVLDTRLRDMISKISSLDLSIALAYVGHHLEERRGEV